MNDLRILRSLSRVENDVFIWQIVINREKQARSARHQQLLDGTRADGAYARDDVGDVLSFGLELGLRLAEAQSMGIGFTIPLHCSMLLQDS